MSAKPPEHDADADGDTDDEEHDEEPDDAILYLLSTLGLEPVVSNIWDILSVSCLYSHRNDAGFIRPECPLFIRGGSLGFFVCVGSDGETAPELRIRVAAAHVVRILVAFLCSRSSCLLAGEVLS